VSFPRRFDLFLFVCLSPFFRPDFHFFFSFFFSSPRFPGRLDSEKRQLEDFQKDLGKSEDVVKAETTKLAEHRKQAAKTSETLDQLTNERREIKERLEAGKTKLAEAAAKLKALKEGHEAILQEIGGLKKLKTAKENEIQKNFAERHATFKKCRMEEIDLPLRKGSLRELPGVLSFSFPSISFLLLLLGELLSHTCFVFSSFFQMTP